MKNLLGTGRQSRQVTSTVLICSLFFLVMCPFAHSLTPCSQAPVLIPQQHVVENSNHQKGYIDSLLNHTYIILFGSGFLTKRQPVLSPHGIKNQCTASRLSLPAGLSCKIGSSQEHPFTIISLFQEVQQWQLKKPSV